MKHFIVSLFVSVSGFFGGLFGHHAVVVPSPQLAIATPAEIATKNTQVQTVEKTPVQKPKVVAREKSTYVAPGVQQTVPVVPAVTDQLYASQYQAVQQKIAPLEQQLDSLNAKTESCMGFSQGTTQIQCTLAINQESDISEYIGALQNDFLIPVTNNSIIYENELDSLHKQIFDRKMDYHNLLSATSGRPIPLADQEGQINKALPMVNAKIDSLNQQIQIIMENYRNGVVPFGGNN